MTWSVNIITLFPDMFPGTLGHSLAGRALQEKVWEYNTVQPRDFAVGVHKSVDDTAFGGGAGMILRADIMDAALTSIPDIQHMPIVYLSPRGKPLNQEMVKKFTKIPKITLICGRYEGIDERLLQHWRVEEVSIGDYILSGGELAAQVFLDACVRLLPGVMGGADSHLEETFEEDLLEYPQYTRPQVWKDMAVPDVLVSGHHEKIRQWRRSQSEELTKQRRPDLWSLYVKDHKKD